MLAHAADFRSEVDDKVEARRLSDALLDNWRNAEIDASDAALCAFAERLTLEPHAMLEDDVLALRRAGFDDVAIHDAVQVISYFNYINRVADGLCVDLEPDMPSRAISVEQPGTTDMLFAAGEAMAAYPSDTTAMGMSWRCGRCLDTLPAGSPLPDRCSACGASGAGFVPVDA
jgi:hypothetical protein